MHTFASSHACTPNIHSTCTANNTFLTFDMSITNFTQANALLSSPLLSSLLSLGLMQATLGNHCHCGLTLKTHNYEGCYICAAPRGRSWGATSPVAPNTAQAREVQSVIGPKTADRATRLTCRLPRCRACCPAGSLSSRLTCLPVAPAPLSRLPSGWLSRLPPPLICLLRDQPEWVGYTTASVRTLVALAPQTLSCCQHCQYLA